MNVAGGLYSLPCSSSGFKIDVVAKRATIVLHTIVSANSIPAQILFVRKEEDTIVDQMFIETSWSNKTDRRPNPNTYNLGSIGTSPPDLEGRNRSGENFIGSGYISGSVLMALQADGDSTAHD